MSGTASVLRIPSVTVDVLRPPCRTVQRAAAPQWAVAIRLRPHHEPVVQYSVLNVAQAL
jgi:hypothetical protein